jgi:hypothetical protein
MMCITCGHVYTEEEEKTMFWNDHRFLGDVIYPNSFSQNSMNYTDEVRAARLAANTNMPMQQKSKEELLAGIPPLESFPAELLACRVAAISHMDKLNMRLGLSDGGLLAVRNDLCRICETLLDKYEEKKIGEDKTMTDDAIMMKSIIRGTLCAYVEMLSERMWRTLARVADAIRESRNIYGQVRWPQVCIQECQNHASPSWMRINAAELTFFTGGMERVAGTKSLYVNFDNARQYPEFVVYSSTDTQGVRGRTVTVSAEDGHDAYVCNTILGRMRDGAFSDTKYDHNHALPAFVAQYDAPQCKCDKCARMLIDGQWIGLSSVERLLSTGDLIAATPRPHVQSSLNPLHNVTYRRGGYSARPITVDSDTTSGESESDTTSGESENDSDNMSDESMIVVDSDTTRGESESDSDDDTSDESVIAVDSDTTSGESESDSDDDTSDESVITVDSSGQRHYQRRARHERRDDD